MYVEKSDFIQYHFLFLLEFFIRQNTLLMQLCQLFDGIDIFIGSGFFGADSCGCTFGSGLSLAEKDEHYDQTGYYEPNKEHDEH